MELVRIGKIVNTHGIKGELRILSDFEFKDKVFKKGVKVYVGKKKKEFIINSYRFHKILIQLSTFHFQLSTFLLLHFGNFFPTCQLRYKT